MSRTHHNRDDLAGEHKYGDAGQAILACIFFVVWITDGSLGYSTFPNQYGPFGVRLALAIALFLLAGYLAVSGLYIVFVKKRDAPRIIREGPFRAVRHPIYLAEILLYLGFLALSTSLAALAVWLVAAGFLHYLSRHEEKLLLERFGEDYRRYMREVSMWLPLPHHKR